jgi:hypothetical protein
MSYKTLAIKIASYLNLFKTCNEADYGCSFVFYSFMCVVTV